MCGIAGGFWSQLPNNLEDRINNAISKMKSRGPDDSGIELFNEKFSCVALAQTRLSIIDLSPSAHQPMFSSDKNFSIIFNGEIYNYLELKSELKSLGYKFNTNSDTEVLLISWTHWGKESLKKFIGMFAFAVYDKNQKTITCARDAFGIKPLYYESKNENFIFGSDINALKELKSENLELNWQRSYDYLVHGDYDSGPQSFIKDILHLMPGHLIEFNVASKLLSEPFRWWTPQTDKNCNLTFDEAASKIRKMFLDSIRLHLRSDVPIGVALSGGIDSSSVTCAIRFIDPDIPINTFSYIAKNSDLSEEAWVDIANDYINAKEHKVYFNSRDLVNDLDDMIYSQGEPFGSTSIYAQYRVFKLAKEHGIKVTLDGQGADELFAGYYGYPGKRIKSLLDGYEFKAALLFLFNWSSWPGRSILKGLKYCLAEFATGNFYNLLRKIHGDRLEVKWINSTALVNAGISLSYPPSIENSKSKRRLTSALANALTCKGLPSLLRHADRSSMRFSIESRVPFLTLDIANFVLSLPEEYLISNKGETKSLFRSAMRGIVPDKILDRKDKVGFSTPEEDILIQMEVSIRGWLSKDIKLSFLNQKEILNEFNMFIAGKKKFSQQIWRWINFVRWYQLVILDNASVKKSA